jgi:hypothetical protein
MEVLNETNEISLHATKQKAYKEIIITKREIICFEGKY